MTEELDLSEFEELSKPQSPICGVKRATDAMSPANRRKVIAALAAPGTRITHVAIEKWFKARGQRVDAKTIGRHRNGGCSCDRPQ